MGKVVKWSEFKPGIVDGLVLVVGILYGAFAWHPTIPDLDIRWDLTGLLIPVSWGLIKSARIVPQKTKNWNVGIVTMGLAAFFLVASFFRCACLKNVSKNGYLDDYIGTLGEAGLYVGTFATLSLTAGFFLFYCVRKLTSHGEK